jgi:hypothetical protein
MYTLIDLHNENQTEYLNSALRRHGLDSFVFKNGVDADGKEIFSIACLNASELKQARHLIYSSKHFLADIHPEAAVTIREIRHQNSAIFMGAITSKPMLAISLLALTAALIGYIFDL